MGKISILILVMFLIIASFLSGCADNKTGENQTQNENSNNKPGQNGNDFPTSLAEQKEYVYDYLSKRGSNTEMSYLGYDKPTSSEIQIKKSNTDLSSNYPSYIKGIFGPGAETNTVDLLYFSDELLDIGVNTYFIIGEYQINNNKAELFHPYIAANGDCSVLTEEEAKLVLAERILMAKELGFSTILVPDYPSAFDKGRESYDITLIEPELKRVALELAEIAQEYKADYLAPVNEYEHLLYSNGYSMEEISPLFSAFYDDLIPRIREIYDGKIIIKCGNVGNWDDFSMLSMTGADLFGVGNAYMSNKGEVSEDIADMAYAADDVSERDDVPWFISEFLVFNSDDQIDMFGEVRSTITTDEAYEEALDAFSLKGSGASGFSFMSWTGTGKIRNTEAAEHVENFFDEK